jgi:hypothetical protein
MDEFIGGKDKETIKSSKYRCILYLSENNRAKTGLSFCRFIEKQIFCRCYVFIYIDNVFTC